MKSEQEIQNEIAKYSEKLSRSYSDLSWGIGYTPLHRVLEHISNVEEILVDLIPQVVKNMNYIILPLLVGYVYLW